MIEIMLSEMWDYVGKLIISIFIILSCAQIISQLADTIFACSIAKSSMLENCADKKCTKEY